jgi:hypothetical protein
MVLMDRWREEFINFKAKLIAFSKQPSLSDQKIIEILDKHISKISKSEIIMILKRSRELEIGKEYFGNLPKLIYYSKIFVFLLSDHNLIYFFLYFICSLLGLVANFYILYPLCLIEIIVSLNY